MAIRGRNVSSITRIDNNVACDYNNMAARKNDIKGKMVKFDLML